jgi:hypothetical protein
LHLPLKRNRATCQTKNEQKQAKWSNTAHSTTDGCTW